MSVTPPDPPNEAELDAVPLFPLPRTCLLPWATLPLHVFEPRYRQMLQHALENERMFCIGTLIAPENATDPASCVHTATTAAFVRACVAQADGCSNLLLQGIQRIRLSDFQTVRPYVTAAVTPITSETRAPFRIIATISRPR